MNGFAKTSNTYGFTIITTLSLARIIFTLTHSMPAGVHIPQRIIAGVAVPVQTLRVARVGDDGVGLDEAPERGVIVSGVVKVQAKGKSK